MLGQNMIERYFGVFKAGDLQIVRTQNRRQQFQTGRVVVDQRQGDWRHDLKLNRASTGGLPLPAIDEAGRVWSDSRESLPAYLFGCLPALHKL